MAASFAAVLLAAGTPGRRFALPHAKVMIHQPWVSGGIGGQASDIAIYAEQILKNKQLINNILAKHTKQPAEKIERDTDRDFWMTATEAQLYGLVDQVVASEAQ
jgi:ATP-dependent Clp protease protease subunit